MGLFKDKEGKKRIERWLGRQWINLILLATRFLTINRARFFGRLLGNAAFYCVVRHRRSALRNIGLIYGKEKSKKELREIIRRTFVRASCFGWETLYLYTHQLNGRKLEDLVERVEGIERLRAAAARGKGVIALGAHLGNFILMGRKLDSLGFANTAIMRQMKDGKLEHILSTMRSRLGQRWIPKLPVFRAIKQSIAWLEAGKVLVLYMDQRSGKGVTADFLGIPTPTPTGPAVFALKTGAAVLPIVNVQEEDGTYKLIIGEEIPLIKTGEYKKDVFDNTVRFNKAIARFVRLYPDQWFWFHNRWKGEEISAR